MKRFLCILSILIMISNLRQLWGDSQKELLTAGLRIMRVMRYRSSTKNSYCDIFLNKKD